LQLTRDVWLLLRDVVTISSCTFRVIIYKGRDGLWRLLRELLDHWLVAFERRTLHAEALLFVYMLAQGF
jgi:hypothetical protein